MPHRFLVSIPESLRFNDSWLSRHAFASTSKKKMRQEMQTRPSATRPQAVALQQNRLPDDDPVRNLSVNFGQMLGTSDTRPPPRAPLLVRGMSAFFAPAPRYPGLQYFPPYYFDPRQIRGQGFHTTRCYSPQFTKERHVLMQAHEAREHGMAASVKRSWEDDRRASYSAEQSCSKYLPAEEYKRHHRSKSCDGLEKNLRQRGFSEKDLRSDVRHLRRWENTDFGKRHRLRPTAGFEFTILTYNVLAQCLLVDNGYLYKHCNPEILEWDYRKVRILKELEEANADVLCLQEIQCNHYEDFFVPELGKLGYTGVFKKRTGDKNDGCAIFFKGELFTLDECISVEYSKPDLMPLDRSRDNIAQVAMLRPKRGGKICVANTHLLFNPGRGDIKLAQLRILLAEIDQFAFRRVSQHSQKPLYYPIILCGDLNSEPNCSLYEFVSTGALRYEGLLAGSISGQAEGYRKGRFILNKELIPVQLGISDQCQYVDTITKRMGKGNSGSGSGKDILEQSGRVQNTLDSGNSGKDPSSSKSESIKDTQDSVNAKAGLPDSQSIFSTGKMTHRLNFVSAYRHNLGRGRAMQDAVTTHHRKSSCMVDYIFYSVYSKDSWVKGRTGGRRVEHQDVKDGALSLVATYGLLSCGELTRLGGLPNSALPSDHLTLIARFLLRDDS